MTKSMDQLILALTKEHDIYQDYFQLAKKKKEIIISGHVAELESITKVEQDMIVTMGKIDHIRTSIVGNLLAELNIKSVESLTELAGYLPKEIQAKIIAIKDKLEQVLGDIRGLNELNTSLLKQSLDYIDFNMNLLLSMESKGSTYSSRADEKDLKKQLNIFDARI